MKRISNLVSREAYLALFSLPAAAHLYGQKITQKNGKGQGEKKEYLISNKEWRIMKYGGRGIGEWLIRLSG